MIQIGIILMENEFNFKQKQAKTNYKLNGSS